METLKRIIVAAIFAPIMIFCTFNEWYEGLLFFTLLLTAAILGTLEFIKIFKKRDIVLNRPLLLTFVIISWGTEYSVNFFAIPLNNVNLWLAIILFFIVCTAEIFKKDFSQSLAKIGGSMTIFFYLGIFFPFTYKVKMVAVNGPYIFLLITSITWMCDSGAYFIGKYFGKHKLRLPVSPNKTLEGFIGAVVFGVATGFAARYIFSANLVLPVFRELQYFIPFILFIVFLTIIGDMIESVFKRSSAVKDSEKTIPGHGGILDAFDSLIITSTATYFVMIFSF